MLMFYHLQLQHIYIYSKIHLIFLKMHIILNKIDLYHNLQFILNNFYLIFLFTHFMSFKFFKFEFNCFKVSNLMKKC